MPFLRLSLLMVTMFGVAVLGMARNMVENNSFETLNDAGNFPVRWGKHWVYTGEIAPVNDIAGARDGSTCLRVTQRGEGASEYWTGVVSSRLRLTVGHRYTASVWVKGQGKLKLAIYLYGAGKALAESLADVPGLHSPFYDIKGDAWEKHTLEVVIPKTGKSSIDKSIIEVEEFELQFFVKGGPVYIDDVELYPYGQAPAKEKTADFFDAKRSPLLTLPRLAAPPVIDGKLATGEWASASATTGFLTLDHKLSVRTPIIYAGFDEENLYFAFVSRQETLQLGMGSEGRFTNFDSVTEGFEFWIQPLGGECHQLLVVPNGGMLAIKGDDNKMWGEAIQYRASVLESSTMSGSIMTMDAKTWLGEARIPFAALGAKAPADGDAWRMNFCRDFSTKGSDRSTSDWTTWAPNYSGFRSVKEFGFARFDRKAPAAQITSLGDLSSGQLALAGKTTGDVLAQSQICLPGKADKTLIDVTDAFAANAAIAQKSAIRGGAAGITPMALRFAIVESKSHELLTQASIPFTLMPAFWIKPRLYYNAGKIEIQVDASRLELPANSVVTIAMRDANGKLVMERKRPISRESPKPIITQDTAGMPSGKYQLKGDLTDASGNILASTTSELSFPAKPVWMGNAIGLDHSVPPPFVPIAVTGQETSLLLRQHQWQNSGLPGQVTAARTPLLTAPARLVVEVDGHPVELTFAPLELLEKFDDVVRWKVAGEAAELSLKGSLALEFDGFARWNVALVAKRPGVNVTRFAMEFPLDAKMALFARGDTFTASLINDIHTQAPRADRLVQLGNASSSWGSWMYSADGWAWDKQFFNELVVGDEKRAFSVMCETDQNIVGARYASFIRDPATDTVILQVNLISAPTRLDGKLNYDYFFQALPVRPEPKDSKKWHISLDPNSVYKFDFACYTSPEGVDFLRNIGIGQIYYDLLPDGCPRWAMDEAAGKAGLKRFQSYGMKLAHNLWYAAVQDSLEEYKTFGAEWDAFPTFSWSTPHGKMVAACLNSSFKDLLLYNAEKILNEMGFDGFYTDASAIKCDNARHGCGYTDSKGMRKPTLNLLATRDFVKRMYRVLKQNGHDRVNFAHTGESPSMAAFIEARTHGEELIMEGLDHYRRLTPDYFRAKYAQTEYGIPYTLYAVFHYSWRKVGDAVPMSEVLMMCLPHRVMVPLTYNLELVPLWKIIDPWWVDAKFIPYWRAECPVTSSKPTEVLTSVFRKPASALVVVSNWSYHDNDAQIAFDSAKLGFAVEACHVIDPATGAKTRLAGRNSVELSVPRRNFKLLLLTAGQ